VRQGEEIYVEFLEKTTRAIAESEEQLVGDIQDQTPKDWRAAIELLQRRFPQRWSKKTNVDVTSGGEPLQDISLNVIHTDAETFEQERREAIGEPGGDGAVPQITDGDEGQSDTDD
jgi:hypothetical protein